MPFFLSQFLVGYSTGVKLLSHFRTFVYQIKVWLQLNVNKHGRHNNVWNFAQIKILRHEPPEQRQWEYTLIKVNSEITMLLSVRLRLR